MQKSTLGIQMSVNIRSIMRGKMTR